MTENRHQQGRRRPGKARSSGKGREKKRSVPEQDDDLSFDETKKEFVARVWKSVPRRLRVPLVAVIVIGAMIVSTRSFWYPPVYGWINKPALRLIIGGEIFLDENRALQEGEVQLLDKNERIISTAATDRTGYVTFNISRADKVAILRFRDKDESAVDLPLAPNELTEGKTFHARVDRKRVEYHEK